MINKLCKSSTYYIIIASIASTLTYGCNTHQKEDIFTSYGSANTDAFSSAAVGGNAGMSTDGTTIGTATGRLLGVLFGLSDPPPSLATRAFWFAKGGEAPQARGAGAYGMIAFTSHVTSTNRPRHMAVCEAFVAGLISHAHADQTDFPKNRRMVTFWPTDATPDTPPAWNDCDALVNSYYDLPARLAIKAAEKSAFVKDSGMTIPLAGRRGPYLIAWTPPEAADSERIWLVLDLSWADTPAQIQQLVNDYRQRIEENPDLWAADGGFNLETLRTHLRYFANRYGREIMAFFGPGAGK